MMAPHGDIERVVLWRRLEDPGLEYCALQCGEQSWHLAGTALLTVADEPCQVTYMIECDAAWTTERVQVTLHSSGGERQLWLEVDSNRRWWRRDGEAAPAHEISTVRGLADVDLGFTPATNTLPVRRTGLAVGAQVEVTAAWVRFPELAIEPLPQRYGRQDERRYRYEARDSGFAADLELDELGLVVRYGGSWARVAESGSPERRAHWEVDTR